jgi:hypothetical protein
MIERLKGDDVQLVKERGSEGAQLSYPRQLGSDLGYGLTAGVSREELSQYLKKETATGNVTDSSRPLPPRYLMFFISVYILAYGQSLTLYDTEQRVLDS